MMEIIRLVSGHLLAGCLAGVVASVGIVATNIGSLRDLMLHTEGGALAFLLLTFGMVVTFGSLAVGGAVLTMAETED